MDSRLCTALIILGLTLSSTVSAVVFVVNETGIDAPDTNPGDGICDAINAQLGAQCTLRAAIMEANALPGFDTIFWADGGASLSLTIPASGPNDASTGDLNITETVAIFGSVADPSLRPTITAEHGDRIFRVQADAVSLTGLRLIGGESPDHGGAIRIDSADGISIDAVEMAFNSAESGGGAIASFFSTVEIARSDLRGNQSPGLGSAIFLNDGQLTLAQSSLRFNEGLGTEFTRSTINMGASGNLALANTTISTNEGVGVRLASGILQVRNTTFTNNTLGSVFFIRGVDTTFFLRNSLLAGGCTMTGPETGTVSTNGYNYAQSDGCDIELGDSNIIGPPPGLGPLQLTVDDFAAYHLPEVGSLLRDSGHPVVGGIGCLETDQLNRNRPIDGDNDGIARCDIGAIEAWPVLLTDEIFIDRFEP